MLQSIYCYHCYPGSGSDPHCVSRLKLGFDTEKREATDTAGHNPAIRSWKNDNIYCTRLTLLQKYYGYVVVVGNLLFLPSPPLVRYTTRQSGLEINELFSKLLHSIERDIIAAGFPLRHHSLLTFHLRPVSPRWCTLETTLHAQNHLHLFCLPYRA